ncbi:hypothetical protein HMPREF0574_1403 [Mobiluncus curtisii subsp. curtisii ATCC 35241]|uniref:Metal-dependent HD superfamily phosphohydrolase n=3 Tax=Actinomycetaceae TaxID=2049 RepID=E6M6A3_9ACTO|nr:hypothetical protein HMPREF0574_1403 [Mobiluncus curtisii subsp. curtisii ATCC 35241]EFU81272.1 hypothetical protein HMPREF0576_1785 [Mobiluncus holmesii ATCC 35242]MCU9987135.1 hypothetical protein [Mobiluncus curtisii]MCV0001038.1 hypothetical protein [Mobiluncus curtisii]NMW49745.1 hypothetical protein [Mobiluncus curtisii]
MMCMAEKIPAWLLTGFARSVAAEGGTAPRDVAESVGTELAQRWMAPERHFHNLEYLKTTLENVDILSEQARDVEAIRLAVWYHGAIFDVSEAAVERGEAGLDVLGSADYAADSLAELGVGEARIEKITDLIRGLYRHQAVEDIDAQVLSDADLCVLAADPQEYLEYLRDIRREYAAYDEARFISARSTIIGNLLSRPQLFWTHGAAGWEEQARENLRAELERLEKTGTTGLDIAGTGAEPAIQTGAIPETAPTSDMLPTPREGTPVKTATKPETGELPEAAPRDQDSEDTDEPDEVNPYAPPDEADLGSTLENVAEAMDTMVMKALKPAEVGLKPLSDVEE